MKQITTNRIDYKNYILEDLRKVFAKQNIKQFHADQIFKWCYAHRVEALSEMTNISDKIAERMAELFYFSQLKLKKEYQSKDGTCKYLFELSDTKIIETAFIPGEKRNTICVSTQVGCKFGCKICVSGENGFFRDLTVSEIVNQILAVNDMISPRKIDNIVFMGIGEPLDNYANLLNSLKILTDKKGLAIPARKICVSTCGVVPGIIKLSEDFPKVKLSVSLHACDDLLRSYLMPVNRQYSLDKLSSAIKKFSISARFPVTLEYVLIKEKNMRDSDIKNLAGLCRKLKSKVNFITVNGDNSEFPAPSELAVTDFLAKVKKANVKFTVRKTRGIDIAAACGQLKSGAE